MTEIGKSSGNCKELGLGIYHEASLGNTTLVYFSYGVSYQNSKEIKTEWRVLQIRVALSRISPGQLVKEEAWWRIQDKLHLMHSVPDGKE
jgi:hypothetical protein